jgi:hypothetical protein
MSVIGTVLAFFTQSDGQYIPRVYVEAGYEFVDPFNRYYVSDDELFPAQVGADASFDSVLTSRDARGFADQIDDWNALTADVGFTAETGHRRVLQHKGWRALYGAEKRSFAHRAAGTTTTVHHDLDSAPCGICGLILPLSVTQIDHRHPQEGGKLLAIVKVLRALGLTVMGPKGVQGKAVRKGDAFGGTVVRKPSGFFNSVIFKEPAQIVPWTSAAFRHNLDDRGNAFLSLMNHAVGGRQALEEACMNSILNLQPSCAPCNGSKSKRLKYKQD